MNKKPGVSSHWVLLLICLIAGTGRSATYDVEFERSEYVVQPGSTFEVRVRIRPAPPEGLYSFGVAMYYPSDAAEVPAADAILVPPALNFDGPRGHSCQQFVGEGTLAAKGTVDFQPALPVPYPASGELLLTFQLTDRSPEPYELQLGVWNTLGATEQTFVSGQGVVLDSDLVFGKALITHPNPGLWVEILNPPHLSFQTGLYEQDIRLWNGTPRTVRWVDIAFIDLPAGVTLFNRYPDIEPNRIYSKLSLARGESLDFKVEYNVADRKPFAQPIIEAIELFAGRLEQDVGEGTPGTIVQGVMLRNRTFFVEFETEKGVEYIVRYTDHLINPSWLNALPPVLGTGSKVLWVDNGPPKTASPPSNQRQRFYKLIRVSP